MDGHAQRTGQPVDDRSAPGRVILWWALLRADDSVIAASDNELADRKSTFITFDGVMKPRLGPMTVTHVRAKLRAAHASLTITGLT